MALNVSYTISDTDEKILLNDIHDVDEWIKLAIAGKINNCWKRFQTEWTTKLLDDETVSAISASRSDFVDQVTNRTDYKTRAQKDANPKP